ncbi:hypothetical protein WQ54_04740 [Bacillus sp. SA1-12]|uniref:hypothetical protein n=1 Tax=Bacillus sp. SA1-12 TaxID=1455638 RepID=UPI000626B56F|nr:hypothetical protein [Bacillus sp. SA1-12]KKI93167.1 hypothetical protein WQ54_04740 [Bacillus sp. SA1-12]
MNLIDVQPVKFSFFEKPPASSMTQAFVYTNAENNYLVVKNGDRISRSDLRAGKYNKVYIVNMSTLNFHYEKEVPSQDRGRQFLVDLSIDYKVVDPISLIQQDAGEIVSYMKKKLPYWLEEITVDYPITESKRVKRHIEDLHEHSSMVSGLKQVGVAIKDINVLVKQSEDDQAHDKKFRAIDQEDELELYRSEKKRNKARALAISIQEAIESGDLLTALLIAEENQDALAIVKNRLQHEEAFRLEVQDQVRKLLLDPTVNEVEVKQQLAKIKAYFPHEPFSGDKPASYEQSVVDPYDETRNMYHTTKGE